MAERLTRDDLLVLLIEECGEVIQAATKCLRFGYEGHHVAEYGVNSVKLSEEVGDLLGVIDALPLSTEAVENKRVAKIDKATRVKQWVAELEAGRTALGEK